MTLGVGVICGGTGSGEEVGRLQNNLDRLGEWAKK